MILTKEGLVLEVFVSLTLLGTYIYTLPFIAFISKLPFLHFLLLIIDNPPMVRVYI